MKNGLILLNAYTRLPQVLNQAERLKSEFEKLGVRADVERNRCGCVYTDGNGEIFNAFGGYDFCVYLDKDKYASLLMEKSGMRLFNSRAAVCACDDKMETHILLAGSGIKMPATVPAPLRYASDVQACGTSLDGVEAALGYPVIVKCCYGSRGAQVFKADGRVQLEALEDKLKTQPHLFQQCITASLGCDVRVIVIGGKVVAAMQRRSGGDFRSNMELGGKGTAIEATDELREICQKAAKILGLDYCGIDVLTDSDGYKVCEVNSNAFFAGIESVTGVNVAAVYAAHICGIIYGE